MRGAQVVDPGAIADLGDFDGAVVASPTSLHADHVAAALAHRVPVLVEKPLARTVAEAGPAATSSDVMVGYNLRFHEPIRRLRRLTEDGRAGPIRYARFWMGSYLPDWRPGTDYRRTYSAKRDAGGGILLDGIHELDLVVWWFGDNMDVVGSVVERVSTLEIDVEDMVDALLRTEDGVLVSVQLDYVSRRYRRGIELVGDEATMRLDWARRVIEIEDRDGVTSIPADTPVDRSYELEIEHFLRWIEGDEVPLVAGPEAAASLRIAETIRTRAG